MPKTNAKDAENAIPSLAAAAVQGCGVYADMRQPGTLRTSERRLGNEAPLLAVHCDKARPGPICNVAGAKIVQQTRGPKSTAHLFKRR